MFPSSSRKARQSRSTRGPAPTWDAPKQRRARNRTSNTEAFDLPFPKLRNASCFLLFNGVAMPNLYLEPARRMSRRRSRQGQKSSARVKIAPYVVPTRMPPQPSARMVPTRWAKFVFAIFLLPVCVVLSQTFFTGFARAAVTQRCWAGEAFWFFPLGAVLWLIAFFGLPRLLVVYVFGHELTHAIWVWLMGGRVTQFNVSRDGGYVVTNKTNFWIALAPYFFPIYSLLAIAGYGGLRFCFDVQPYGGWLYSVLGGTWGF